MPEMTTEVRQVRLLLNDVDPDDQVFTDADVDDFLAMEGGHVKLAAAQAIDTNASNEALASKVLRSQDWQTDGAKLADALRKHAAALREQHAASVADDDGGFFTIVDHQDW
jgi:hypothetical protein